MKGTIGCWLFGYIFRDRNHVVKDGKGFESSIPSKYCRKCGLSKKELGI